MSIATVYLGNKNLELFCYWVCRHDLCMLGLFLYVLVNGEIMPISAIFCNIYRFDDLVVIR